MGGSVFQGYCNEGLTLSKVDQGAPTKLPRLDVPHVHSDFLWQFVGDIYIYTVDGKNLAPVDKQFISKLSHCLLGIYIYIHPRWLAGFLPSTVS